MHWHGDSDLLGMAFISNIIFLNWVVQRILNSSWVLFLYNTQVIWRVVFLGGGDGLFLRMSLQNLFFSSAEVNWKKKKKNRSFQVRRAIFSLFLSVFCWRRGIACFCSFFLAYFGLFPAFRISFLFLLFFYVIPDLVIWRCWRAEKQTCHLIGSVGNLLNCSKRSTI